VYGGAFSAKPNQVSGEAHIGPTGLNIFMFYIQNSLHNGGIYQELSWRKAFIKLLLPGHPQVFFLQPAVAYSIARTSSRCHKAPSNQITTET
jgi:hypothetical protein